MTLTELYTSEWRRLTWLGRLLWFPLFSLLIPLCILLIVPTALLFVGVSRLSRWCRLDLDTLGRWFYWRIYRRPPEGEDCVRANTFQGGSHAGP